MITSQETMKLYPTYAIWSKFSVMRALYIILSLLCSLTTHFKTSPFCTLTSEADYPPVYVNYPIGLDPNSVTYSPNGSYLATANYDSNNVSVFSVGADGTLSPVPGSPFTTGLYPNSVAYSPDGSYLATANNPIAPFTSFLSTDSGLSDTQRQQFTVMRESLTTFARLSQVAGNPSGEESIFSILSQLIPTLPPEILALILSFALYPATPTSV